MEAMEIWSRSRLKAGRSRSDWLIALAIRRVPGICLGYSLFPTLSTSSMTEPIRLTCSINRALGFFSGEVRDLVVGISPESLVDGDYLRLSRYHLAVRNPLTAKSPSSE